MRVINMEFTRGLKTTFILLSRWSGLYARSEYILYILPVPLRWHLVRNSKENPGFIETNPHFIEVSYQGNRFKLRTLYDIVGWIFSVVGNVPDLATRENYYYPLMMIAYVFSKKLVPDVTFQPRNGNPIVKSAPDVWMVMWFNQMVDNQLVTRVVLGATLDMPTAQVKGGTKYFRKNLLREAGIIKEGVLAPLQQHGRQDFGHCAESYPLLFIWS